MAPGLETESGLRAQLDAAEAAIATAFTTDVSWLQSQSTIVEIAAAIEERRVNDIVSDANIQRFAESVAAATTAQYIAAAIVVAEYLARKLEHPVHFDPTNGRAMLRIHQNNAYLVREVTDEVRAVIREAVSDGIELGLNPKVHARMLRGSLGLTQKQYAIVSNYRRKLQANDGSALGNELRDRRFDDQVSAASAGDEPLTSAQIEKMVARYQERFIKYRSEAIGRTEAQRSVHEGADDMWAESVSRGDVDPVEMERIWKHHGGPNQRENHVDMHNQVRGFGEAFRSGSGWHLRYPCDPNAPASETVHCHCCVITRFKRASESST